MNRGYAAEVRRKQEIEDEFYTNEIKKTKVDLEELQKLRKEKTSENVNLKKRFVKYLCNWMF